MKTLIKALDIVFSIGCSSSSGEVVARRDDGGKLSRDPSGVMPVPGPFGAAITTRLRVTETDIVVLDAVAEHLGRLRRADLTAVSRPEPLDPSLDGP